MRLCLWGMGLLFLLTAEVTAKETYLTARDIKLIRANWSDYRYAAQKVSVPVVVLAAIHYREADLHKGWYSKRRNKVIKNIGGPFMLDFGPVGNHVEFARRIRAHEKVIYNLYGLSPTKISHDFRFSAIVAADHLKKKANCGLMKIECLAYAVWGYNGRARWHKGDHRNSSYVWSDPKNGKVLMMRYKDKEFPDTRPGVMIIYKELVALIKGEK